MSRKTDQTRARILQTTLDLLASGTPANTRISDIAKASGLSRQALYLHFPTRAELLIAATKYLDEKQNIDASLARSRSATTGEVRLGAFITAWAEHIPVIYPVGRALMAMQDTDPEARAAWEDRMAAVRHGCAAAVAALARDRRLRVDLTETAATDLLCAILSVRTWEYLVRDRGWTADAYAAEMIRLSRAAVIEGAAP